jgi:hypothetical protein
MCFLSFANKLELRRRGTPKVWEATESLASVTLPSWNAFCSVKLGFSNGQQGAVHRSGNGLNRRSGGHAMPMVECPNCAARSQPR